jgi:hypothetical protein
MSSQSLAANSGGGAKAPMLSKPFSKNMEHEFRPFCLKSLQPNPCSEEWILIGMKSQIKGCRGVNGKDCWPGEFSTGPEILQINPCCTATPAGNTAAAA